MNKTQVLCFLLTTDREFLPAYVDEELIVAAFNGDQSWMGRFEITVPPGYAEKTEFIGFADFLAPYPNFAKRNFFVN